MHIVVDVRSLFDRPTGLGVFGAQCIERMLALGHTWSGYAFGGKQPGETLHALLPTAKKLHHNPLPMRAMRQLWRRRIAPPIESFCGDADVVFATEMSLPRTEAPAISVIHDALFLDHPEWFPPYVRRAGPENLDDALNRAATVLHSSETVRQRLAARFAPLADKSVVVPPSVRVEPRWKGKGKYILFVGTWEPRKGLGVVARALLRSAHPHRLVVAGKAGWGNVPGAKAGELLAHQGRFDVRGFVSDDKLATLREHCALAVIPSLDEGFGLPLLEALAAGVPCLASDIPVFREIAGDECAYANVNEPDSWADALDRLLGEPSLLRQFSERGIERAGTFSAARQSAALDALLTQTLAAA